LLLILLPLIVGVSVVGCGKKANDDTQYHCPMHPTYTSDRMGDCPICGMRLVPIEKDPGGSGDTTSGGDEARATTGQSAARSAAAYSCPMHPEVTSDEPGKCPKCGMALEPTTSDASPAREDEGTRRILFYRHPMNPEVTSPVPAKDEMGMDYVPVYTDEAGGGGGASGVEGMATLTVDRQGRRLAGIQTVTARREALSQTIRTVGTVTADESRVRHVHTKVSGWIEKLNASFTGQFVERGQAILRIYSPELLASQEEYLRARRAAEELRGSGTEGTRTAEALLDAARRRLELFDVPRSFIEEIEHTGKPQRAVTLVAPASGYVFAREVFEGQRIEPGMELFTVTDLSQVWIVANFYEYEASLVRVGQRANLKLAYDPEVKLTGRVAYVYPFVTPDSRTLEVRFEFANPGLKLKPGMFADVWLDTDAREGVVVPGSAIIDTGERKIVFVEVSDGRFEPREIEARRIDDKAQVFSGVREGERVVTRANFLLDSESRLRAAISEAGAAPVHDHGSEP
jgi:RND family efflux transporter MFP subunit